MPLGFTRTNKAVTSESPLERLEVTWRARAFCAIFSPNYSTIVSQPATVLDHSNYGHTMVDDRPAIAIIFAVAFASDRRNWVSVARRTLSLSQDHFLRRTTREQPRLFTWFLLQLRRFSPISQQFNSSSSSTSFSFSENAKEFPNQDPINNVGQRGGESWMDAGGLGW